VERQSPFIEDDRADDAHKGGRKPYDASLTTDPDVLVYRISGAFFFGAAASVAAVRSLVQLTASY
jgi:SulP family sulfate permease